MATSQRSNVDVVKGIYEAVEHGDVDAVVDALDENVEWIEPEGGTYGGTYRGPDDVVENVLGNISGEWEEFTIEPERFVTEDDTVVALVKHRGTHAKTSEHFVAPIADVWNLDDGLITRFQHYLGSISYVQSRE